MFSLFKRKRPLYPTVSPENKLWIEGGVDWLIQNFSFAIAKDQPFILPQKKAASSGKATAGNHLQMILENLCKRWEVDPASVVLEILNDMPTKKWYSFVEPNNEHAGTAGLYKESFEGTQKKFHIHIAQSMLKYNDITTAVLTHELAHAKLLGENYLNFGEPDMEPLTDLACIYFGFGILFANTCFTDRVGMMRLGYLPNPMISYANALLCYITEYDPAKIIANLNVNTRELFKRDYNYLITTNDTLLTKAHIQKSDQFFHTWKEFRNASKVKNFDYIIETSNSLLGTGGDDDFLLDYIGHAYFEKEQFHAAIETFTKAIDKTPDRNYPYRNRGLCRLLLGEVDAAYPDLCSALKINECDSYTRRNLGIYFMLKNDHTKALEHFELAEKIDPTTEMINFCLGLVHQRCGNIEKANDYFNKSEERAESNDAIFSLKDR